MNTQTKYLKRGLFDLEIDSDNQIVILIVYRDIQNVVQKELSRLERKFPDFAIHEIYYLPHMKEAV